MARGRERGGGIHATPAWETIYTSVVVGHSKEGSCSAEHLFNLSSWRFERIRKRPRPIGKGRLSVRRGILLATFLASATQKCHSFPPLMLKNLGKNSSHIKFWGLNKIAKLNTHSFLGRRRGGRLHKGRRKTERGREWRRRRGGAAAAAAKRSENFHHCLSVCAAAAVRILRIALRRHRRRRRRHRFPATGDRDRGHATVQGEFTEAAMATFCFTEGFNLV